MFEQSSSEIPSSIWASMNSWFTPAVFFVLLNLMIGTIALTSTLTKKHQNQNQNEAHHQPKFAGSVLQRIKSSNFLSYYNNNNRSQDPQNSSIHKQAPDSDTHFSPEQTLNHETESHYFFQENSAQDPRNSSIYKQAPDSDTHFNNPEHTENHEIVSRYLFQENSAEDPQDLSIGKKTPDSVGEHSQNLETQSNYFFQENLQISQSQASNPIFEQKDEQIPQKSQTHFVCEQKDSNLNDFEEAPEAEDSQPSEQSMDEVYSQLTGGHFSRTKSDTEPVSGKIPGKLPAKMKKSASLKSAFGHFEEEKIVEARRPATVRESGNTGKATDGDEGVDAKADDFIHKFKQQLKLQRLDSIVRYKDMIGRGSGGR